MTYTVHGWTQVQRLVNEACDGSIEAALRAIEAAVRYECPAVLEERDRENHVVRWSATLQHGNPFVIKASREDWLETVDVRILCLEDDRAEVVAFLERLINCAERIVGGVAQPSTHTPHALSNGSSFGQVVDDDLPF